MIRLGLLLVLLLASGCVDKGPDTLSMNGEVARATDLGWHHRGAGAVTFTLTWTGDATVEGEVLFPPDTEPYRSGFVLVVFDNEGVDHLWTVAANGGQGAAIEVGPARNVSARPLHEPFTGLPQPIRWSSTAPDGPRTLSFAVVAASGEQSVPIELWVNATTFEIVDGPHAGPARALAFDGHEAAAAVKARLGRVGGTAVVESRIGWETTNGTVAFYWSAMGGVDSVGYERSRLVSPTEAWESDQAFAAEGAAAYGPHRAIPHDAFVLVSHETRWTYEVMRRVHANSPVELLLVGDVRPPAGFVSPGTSLLGP